MLWRDGAVVPLTPKALDTLRVLVERQGQVVSKEELMDAVWADVHVEEAVLTQNIYTLRKALGEVGTREVYIETLPRRGYRFVPPVQRPASAVGGVSGPAAGVPRSRRRWLPLLLAVVLLGLAAAWALWLRPGGDPPPGPRRPPGLGSVSSIAVLPFVPLEAKPEEEDEVMGLAMADALITRLSKLKRLAVRPTSSIRGFTGDDRDPAAAGRRLGVDAVIDGTLQRSGEQLRLSVQLIGVDRPEPLWAESFDTVFTDLFAVQDSISRQVAERLPIELTRPERESLAAAGPANPEAYRAYVQGRYFWNRRTAEGLDKAREYFQLAIDRDPSYVAAWAGLADTWVLLPFYGAVTPREAFPQAIAAASQALAADPTLAEAHTSLAYARFLYEWDWTRAEAGFRRAIEEKPGYATAHHWYSYLLAALGRFDEARVEADRALALDPLSLIINADEGFVAYFARRPREASRHFDKALELDPDFAYAHFGLGLTLGAQGSLEEAVARARRAVELSDSAVMQGALGYLLGTAGQAAQARQILDRLEAQAAHRYVPAAALALVHIGLDERREALEALAQACDERSRFVVFLGIWPVYDRLRQEPGFYELIQRVGLPDHPREGS